MAEGQGRFFPEQGNRQPPRGMERRGGNRFNVTGAPPVPGFRPGGVTTPERPAPTPTLPRPDTRQPVPEQAPQKPKKHTVRNIALAGTALGALGLGVGAYEGYQNIPAVHRAVDSRFLDHIKGKSSSEASTNTEGTLAPKESVSWWQEIPQEKIQSLAQIPSINIIGGEYKSAVSPLLQQRARDAGYEIIYQGDPNDTVGRTVIAKGRQSGSKDWTYEDQGFGRAGGKVRGIFQVWVPDPKDPNQQDHVYALLKNPNSGEEYTVRMELQPFDSNSSIRPTWFAVDDLNNGPSIIQEASKVAGFDLPSEQIPTSQDPPDKKWKRPSEFPTFDDLLRKQGLSLTNLVKPGDYVMISMQMAGVDQTKGDYIYRTDDVGIAISGAVVVRRFGGEPQWASELPKQ